MLSLYIFNSFIIVLEARIHTDVNFTKKIKKLKDSLVQESPNSRPWTSTFCQISSSIRLEIKCTINVMCLKHPESTALTTGFWKNCLLQNLSLVPKRCGPLLQGFLHYTLPTVLWYPNRTTVPNWWAEDQRNMKRDATLFQISLLSLFVKSISCYRYVL